MTAYEKLTTLTLREQMRLRPAMWVGNVLSDEYESGKNHLPIEVVGNAMDEHMAGHGKKLIFKIEDRRVITVQDFGRGIPHGISEKTGNSFVVDAASEGSTGGKYAKGDDESPYRIALGLHGYGLKATNFMSEWLRVSSVRAGQKVTAFFEEGLLKDVKTDKARGEPNGTTVTFKPDEKVFPTPEINPDHMRRYLTGLAYLNPGLQIEFHVRTGEELKVEDLSQPEGLYALLETLAPRDRWLTTSPLHVSAKDDAGNSIETLLLFTKGEGEIHDAFCNSGAISISSAPVATLRSAIARGVGDAITSTFGKQPEGTKPDDLRNGVVTVTKIMHSNPAYDGQTKTKLVNTDMNPLISTKVSERVVAALMEDMPNLTLIRDHVARIVRAREAARLAREKAMNDEAEEDDKKTAAPKLVPLKVYNPPNVDDPSRNQLFMCEGESAAGAIIEAAKARDPATGKIYKTHIGLLALKGVTLSPLEHKLSYILGRSQEYATLVVKSGLNPKNPDDLSKVKFKDFIIATDEDAGGAFIGAQLMTFFIVHFPAVIRAGRLSRIRTPLFEVSVKKQPDRFIYEWDDVHEKLREFGLDPEEAGKKFNVKRNKGLGEMGASSRRFLVANQNLQRIQHPNPEELIPLLELMSASGWAEQRRDILENVALPDVVD